MLRTSKRWCLSTRSHRTRENRPVRTRERPAAATGLHDCGAVFDPDGSDADLYVNAKYFGAVFASAEPADVAARLAATQRPFAARCLTDKAPDAVGWKTISSWYVIGDADKVIPPDIQAKFAARAKSKIYHVPGGDHPSMIAHPEITVSAIRDAANAVSR